MEHTERQAIAKFMIEVANRVQFDPTDPRVWGNHRTTTGHAAAIQKTAVDEILRDVDYVVTDPPHYQGVPPQRVAVVISNVAHQMTLDQLPTPADKPLEWGAERQAQSNQNAQLLLNEFAAKFPQHAAKCEIWLKTLGAL